MFEKAAKERARDFTDNKERQIAYECGFLDGVDFREKRIVELEKKISVLLSCKKCSENKGGYICKKEYEDKCLAQKIQYIKELQEENVELKAKIEKLKCCQNCKHHYWLYEELACRIHKIDVDTCNSWEMKND